MSNREDRAEVARETLEILDRGHYSTDSGERIDLKKDLSYTVNNTELFGPEELEELEPEVRPSGNFSTRVTNKTTLQAAKSLAESEKATPFVLNFASAKNPGGGFLNGSGAQEESLARKSGLYACLNSKEEYYQRNKKAGNSLYTDNMIYSPRVPVFRDRDDQLLDSSYHVSILTAPAVNKRAVKRTEPELLSKVRTTMDKRIEKVLKVALHKGHVYLVLGAWGCGVFGNSSEKIAELFKKNLKKYYNSGGFEEVVFAVLDRSPNEKTFKTFKRILEE